MTQVWSAVLPATEKLVLLALADHANDDGYCFPSYSSLARRCSLSDRQVRRTVAKLADRGILRIGHSYRDDGGQSSNAYSIVVDSLTESDAVDAADDRTPLVADVQGPLVAGDHPPRTPVTTPPGHGCPGPPGHGCPPNHKKEPSEEPSDEPGWPPALNREAWRLFDQHRRSTAKLRANWTDVARRRAIAQLITLDHDQQQELVDYSITGGYPGLYLDRVKPRQSRSSHRPKGAITRALEAFDAAERLAETRHQDRTDPDDGPTPRLCADG